MNIYAHIHHECVIRISDVLDECGFVHRINLLERVLAHQNRRGERKS